MTCFWLNICPTVVIKSKSQRPIQIGAATVLMLKLTLQGLQQICHETLPPNHHSGSTALSAL